MDLKKYIEKFSFIGTATDVADELNFDAFIIGGVVRDIILGRKNTDVDILVIGDGPKYAAQFAEVLGVKDVIIYRNFGTAHFVFDDYKIEIVGARKESYNRQSRKPDVTSGSFEDDIKRRDFTINTLAVSINRNSFGQIIDTCNGFADLEAELIKTPVDPMITFDDDPLRILRAYRFASQLGFNVHPSVDEAAAKLKDRLSIVSQERITDEFFKILASPKPSTGLIMIFKTGVMEIIFPEIANLAGVEQRKDYHHKDVFYHTCEVVDNISEKTNDVWLRFAALVHDIAKPPTKRFIEGTGWTFHGHEDLGAKMMPAIFKRMKLPMNKLHYIETLIRLHLRPISLVNDNVTDSAIRRFIVSAGEYLDDLITLCRADITSKNPDKVNKYLGNYEKVMNKVLEVQEKDELRAFQSPVSGDVIMQVCKLKPSKKVGEIKTAIEEAILDGIIGNNYEEAYRFLLKLKAEQNL